MKNTGRKMTGIAAVKRAAKAAFMHPGKIRELSTLDVKKAHPELPNAVIRIVAHNPRTLAL